MNLTGILARLDTHKTPGVLCFEKGRVVRRDYPTVRKDVDKAIERLKGYGVKAGMRVGIRATNCYPWIVYDIALLELRGVSVAFTEDFFPTPADELAEKYKLALILGYSKDKPHLDSPKCLVALMDTDGPEGVKADDCHLLDVDPDF